MATTSPDPDAPAVRFPPGFLLGAATAAYQIEGAVRADGRGLSIWDTFSHTPGRIADGSTGDVACDHYHRWREDVALLADLGLNAYRFAVAWPRVLPEGTGRVNQAGLDFYRRLVDALLEAGVTPALTLYHWDLPQALQDRGGWAERSTADAFAAYAEVVAGALGDRVPLWITHNEPSVVTLAGHVEGKHAPGVSDLRTAVQVAHHLLLSHGLAAQALRAAGAGEVGITLNLYAVEPAGDAEADVAAAGRAHAVVNRWFLEPVAHGRYPAELLAWFEEEGLMPAARDGDLDTIRQPLDFLGVNYYTRLVAAAGPGAVLGYRDVGQAGERTEMGWEVYPEGLHQVLSGLAREGVAPALYVTENGAAFADQADPDGRVRDPRRVAYLDAHFRAAARAIAEGVPLRGYFVWSLLDNFEWAFGYTKRFGLAYVDYPTQRRIVKDSGRYVREVARGEP
ncbi:MAG TPA: GH1 family beta-glucosidase [Actinomycetota bacterium]|nr:GH1 family beta-glucosidase [Actinomycetota bacterium]